MAAVESGRFLQVAYESSTPPYFRGIQLWPSLAGSKYVANGSFARTNYAHGKQIRWRVSCSSTHQESAPGNGRHRAQSFKSAESERAASSSGKIEKFFATCAPGLEEIVAAELCSSAIGAGSVQIGSAGVSFCGTKRTGILANLWLRSGIRVLIELASAPLTGRRRADPVYEFVRSAADWPTLLVDNDFGTTPSRVLKFRTFSVNSRVYDCEGISNSLFASVRAKDAICDALKDACGGRRPDPPKDGVASADMPLFLSLYRNRGVLYRDMTGVSLHKRGYRDIKHRAGLNEAIAAGLLTVAGWNTHIPGFGLANRNAGGSSKVLLDPMCGSGTFLIEAALMALNSAPGLMRTQWPFETWHDFDPSVLKACREEAIAAEVIPPKHLKLVGNDIHEGALSLCEKDARAANVLHMLDLSCKDCKEFVPRLKPSLVVVNPPWGARLEGKRGSDYESLLTTWRNLGKFLKSRCSDADVYVLSGNPGVTQALHMKADKKWAFTVGGVDCRVMHYHVLPPKAMTNTLEDTAHNITTAEASV
ncbi:hypothetical protein R1flu_007906 [Riccia fluitans]|uniref:Uncharacterized protein n=1 Tax=Riccia fluitans TaxID=41844 RepID=A0ABD1Z4C1_9MARC